MNYPRDLGMAVRSVEGEGEQARLTLDLPFKETNSNPGGALHGGVAASMILIGSTMLTRRALAVSSTVPIKTSMAQIQYLAAAINEDIYAVSKVLRTGKTVCYVETIVRTKGDKNIAMGLTTMKVEAFEFPDPNTLVLYPSRIARPQLSGDVESDVMQMGRFIAESVPFIHHLGMRIHYMKEGRCQVTMPVTAAVSDDGPVDDVHEGAVTALLDTCGAMASWAATNGDIRNKAATVSLQVQHVQTEKEKEKARPPPQQPQACFTAFGHNQRREGDLFWSDVEVFNHHNRQVARGTVLYRIVGSTSIRPPREKKNKTSNKL